MAKRLTGMQLVGAFLVLGIIALASFALVVAITSDDEREVPAQNNWRIGR